MHRSFRALVGLMVTVTMTSCASQKTVEERIRAPDPITSTSYGIVVYGGTPAGIAAAITAARDGQRVLLVEPTDRIGGMITSGLSHTDFRTFEGLTGSFRTFANRVEVYYREKYGDDSQQVKHSFRGTQGEPSVNLRVFEEMVAECAPKLEVWRSWTLVGVSADTFHPLGAQVGDALLRAANGEVRRVNADVFIDATYEGDLMAKAGVEFRVGREGRAEYNEPLAPDQPDGQLQAYNFRLSMTKLSSNRVPVAAPPRYRREDFAGILPLFESKNLKHAFDYPKECVFKAQVPMCPNGKFDINDVSGGVVRLSLPGENLAWPNGDAAARKTIFDAHLYWEVGLMYFLQNDPAVPATIREESREYGWCRDEFESTGHLPPQLYVREARRMVGRYVFTEHDTDAAPTDARSVLHTDAIAMGDYGNNCHGTAHEGSRFGGKHTGEFYKAVSPYQIPYSVLVPKGVTNLLVPGAVSSSHVGFCALRLEPIWMSLGEAAGHAAHLAIEKRVNTVADVSVPEIQRRLHATGAATIYVSDVLPGHVNFTAVQWWGTAGGFHGIVGKPPTKAGQRGKNINGQYYEAYPNHAAQLEAILTTQVAERWEKLAGELKIDVSRLPKADGKVTRGEWLATAWAAR